MAASELGNSLGLDIYLPLTDNIVRIKCANSEKCFNIHESLLTSNASSLTFRQENGGLLSAEVDCEEHALELFVHWLYTEEIPGEFDEVTDEIDLFIPAYDLGRQAGCVVFADTMIDQLIDRMTSDGVHFSVDEIIRISSYFEVGSGGWNFLIDFLVHKTPFDYGRQLTSIYETLIETEEHELFSELTRRICLNMDLNVSRAVCDHEDFSKMLISGFFAAKVHANEEGPKETYPWTEDVCQYHLHTELGLRCYVRQR